MCLLVHRAQDMEFSITPVLDMKTMNEMKRRQWCLVWCAGVAFLRCSLFCFVSGKCWSGEWSVPVEVK